MRVFNVLWFTFSTINQNEQQKDGRPRNAKENEQSLYRHEQKAD